MLKPNEASDKGVVDAHKRGKGSWGPPMNKLVVGGTNFDSVSKSSQIDLKALEEDEAKLKDNKAKLAEDRKAFEDEKAKHEGDKKTANPTP